MLSSNNVIYSFQVAYDKKPEDLVIDYNERSIELVKEEEKAYKTKLFEEEKARRLKEMEETGAEVPEGVSPEEFLGLADTIMAEEASPEPDVDYVAQAKEEAEGIIAEANSRAGEIIGAAQVNAEALKNLARQEGEKEGYNEGTQRAAMELQQAKTQMKEEIEAIKADYQNRSLSMEHDIVEMCLPVFEKVFNASLAGKKDVIYHLLDHCIMKIERTKQMQIKVGEANADFIKSKKDEIVAKVGSDVNIDIIADPLLTESQCIIETDGGIFDCSIDTELSALISEIRALS